MDRLEDSRLDAAFDALADSRRREILLRLAAVAPDGQTSLGSGAIASGDEDVDTVRTELYHVHLPKLAEAGYVEWAGDALVVSPGPRFEEIAPLVDLLNDPRLDLDGA